MTSLRPDTAVVTGANGGIGRAVVEDLLTCGVHVIGVDRTVDPHWLDTISAQWPGQLEFECLDLAVEQSVVSFCDRQGNAGRPVSYLVNAAALQRSGEFSDLPTKAWNLVMDVNVHGTFFMTRGLVAGMAARGFGRIVTFSSLYADMPAHGQAAYAASKGAVVSLTRSVALDHASRGVTANTVAPGLIWHDNLRAVYTPDEFEMLAKDVPAGRTGTPGEITPVVRFLLSDEASYLTGQVVAVNGGLHLR